LTGILYTILKRRSTSFINLLKEVSDLKLSSSILVFSKKKIFQLRKLFHTQRL